MYSPLTDGPAEFIDLWAGLKTPNPDDLAAFLEKGSSLRCHLLQDILSHSFLTRHSAGLAAASSVPTAITAKSKKKGRKGAGQNNRRLTITNTHLKDLGIDVSKDYVPVKK